jgi:hypothetical protein
MSDRIHVRVGLDLEVEDVDEMRDSSFQRLKAAWSQDEDFPYESAADVPLDEVVHSLLAAALPTEMPGCKRSQLQVDVEGPSGDESEESSPDESEESSPDRSEESSPDRSEESSPDRSEESSPDESEESSPHQSEESSPDDSDGEQQEGQQPGRAEDGH